MEMNLEMVEIFRSNVVEWMIDMLISDEIMLNDIPVQIRTSGASSKSIYISALRISNQISCRRFIRDLEILSTDILLVKDEQYQDELIGVLWDYLNMNEHKGEERFEAYKENIDEEILCKLQLKYRLNKEKLQAQLRKYKFKKKR